MRLLWCTRRSNFQIPTYVIQLLKGLWLYQCFFRVFMAFFIHRVTFRYRNQQVSKSSNHTLIRGVNLLYDLPQRIIIT